MLAASGAVAGVGVAGAAEERQAAATIYASEDGSWCFTTDAGLSCSSGAPADVPIATGETVDFAFPGNAANPGNNYTQPHNAMASSGNWSWSSGGVSAAPQPTKTTPPFNQPGTYTFVCQLHSNMTGTIRVGDPPEEPPGSTVTAIPTTSATPLAPPSGGAHVHTPAPGGGADTVDPAISRVRMTGQRRAVSVRFRLSEPATVTIRVKRRGSRKVLKSARVQASAGTRTVTLRSSKLTKGRYTVDIQARDALGNRSSPTTKRLTLRR